MKLARDDVEGKGSQRRRHTFDWIPTVNDMMWPGNWFKEFRSIYFLHPGRGLSIRNKKARAGLGLVGK